MNQNNGFGLKSTIACAIVFYCLLMQHAYAEPPTLKLAAFIRANGSDDYAGRAVEYDSIFITLKTM